MGHPIGFPTGGKFAVRIHVLTRVEKGDIQTTEAGRPPATSTPQKRNASFG